MQLSNETNKANRYRQLRDNWRRVQLGMTIAEAEQIMRFSFNSDSENKAGRFVYSHRTSDYLPFYLVVDKASGKIVRRQDIRVSDEI